MGFYACNIFIVILLLKFLHSLSYHNYTMKCMHFLYSTNFILTLLCREVIEEHQQSQEKGSSTPVTVGNGRPRPISAKT